VSDTTSGYPGAPPGWYPDPAGGPGQRWWDGYAWTETVVVPAAPEVPAVPAAPPPPPYQPSPTAYHAPNTPGAARDRVTLVADELRVTPVARLAMALPGLYYLLSVVNLRLHEAQYRMLGHEYHRVYEATQNNRPAPTVTMPNGLFGGLSVVISLIGLVTLGAIVVGCVWQHRAATAARSLGRPARHSPGWGVGSWFVPVVNYWTPYQAIRDCLDPGDPGRAVVLRWWLCLVGAFTFSFAALVASLFSGGAALVFIIPGALLCLGVIGTGPRVVVAVAASHQAALAHPPA
jgi:Domain of unknown function (DUF4328)/Protein of unknown function (DUF2510)